MKNILIGISLIVLLASCGSGKDTKEQEQKPEAISISSWDFITEYNADPDNYLGSFEGETITITNILVSYNSYDHIVGLGYNGEEVMTYSKPSLGYTVFVGASLMAEHKGGDGFFNIYETILDDTMEIIDYESVIEEDEDGVEVTERRTIYHTIVSIEVKGENITLGDTGALTITGGKVVNHKNM